MLLKQLIEKNNINELEGNTLLNADINLEFNSYSYNREDDVYQFNIKNNPDIILRLNLDRMMLTLYEKNGGTVKTTTWKYDKKISKEFPLSNFRGLFGSKRT